jgi:hypothetical protein
MRGLFPLKSCRIIAIQSLPAALIELILQKNRKTGLAFSE